MEIGEFLDLIPLLDWCNEVGFDFIQLLPVNDSGFDNSPYNPVSILALNPVYLSLYALPFVNKDEELLKLLKKKKTQKLPTFVQYNKMRSKKFDFLRIYYDKYAEQIKKTKNYKSFIQNNNWVFDYGLFCALAAVHESDKWSTWPEPSKTPTKAQKKQLLKKHKDEAEFYILIQYFCFEQLSTVHKLAKQKKVFLFGDLPFLVSRESCDCWSSPDLFLIDYSVGSPPDNLTPDGQNWNFPAYNWKMLAKTDYAWWKERLKVSENFYDIYRLDHIIGFFRTWNIPRGKEGKDGAYCPQDATLWLDNGYQFLLTLIQSSNMMPIGEDLVIPQTIKDVIRELGICGTNILTWQRTGAGGADFVPYPLYVSATITHIASHDTATLNQWWINYPKVAKAFCLWKNWEYTKTLSDKMRFEILYDSHHTSSLFHANLLQEYLALFPEMVHKEYNKERINYPGTASGKNWRYRIIPSVEEIINSRKLREVFKKLTH